MKERLGLLPPSEFRVLVLTFAEAPSLLSRYVREGVAEPARPRRERVVRVDEALLGQVRDGYSAMVEAFNACRKVITDHNQRGGPQFQLPGLPKATGTLRSFVKQLLDAEVAPEEAPARTLPPNPARAPAPPWVQREVKERAMAETRGEQVPFEWSEQGGEKAPGATPEPMAAPARPKVARPRRKASRAPEAPPALPPDDEHWDVHAAARFLKRSVSWVYHRAEDGTLPVRRLGGWGLRFIPGELRAWVESGGVAPVRRRE